MSLTEKQLIDGLQLYGTAMEAWPEELRARVLRARQHPTFAAQIREQERFESLLRQRGFEPAHNGLADRILAAAHPVHRRERAGIAAWLQELLGELPVLQNPALVLASVLMLGFAIGFGATSQTLPGSEDYNTAFTFLEEDGVQL